MFFYKLMSKSRWGCEIGENVTKEVNLRWTELAARPVSCPAQTHRTSGAGGKYDFFRSAASAALPGELAGAGDHVYLAEAEGGRGVDGPRHSGRGGDRDGV